MKLNKKILKTLIMESLEEMSDPRDEMTGTAYDDVRAGMESEPQPEDFGMPPDDIAGYFRQVGDEIRQRIEAYDQIPKHKMKMMSDEQLKDALEEMDRVQDELEEIKKVLQDLEKRELQSHNDTDRD